MDQTIQNIRFALRTLRKNRTFALFAILTLGLGIGANTAIFSVIDGVLLKPLPYTSGDRLLLVRQSAPLAGRPNTGVSIKELYDYREQTGVVRRAGRIPPDEFRPAEAGGTGSRQHRRRLARFLRRARHRADRSAGPSLRVTTRQGADAVLVLSNSYWLKAFGGDPSHRRAGVPDERSAAHRHRRPAGRAALSAGERRLHVGVGVPVPGRRREAHHAEPPRLRGAHRVRPAQARRSARDQATSDVERRLPSFHRGESRRLRRLVGLHLHHAAGPRRADPPGAAAASHPARRRPASCC